MTLPKEDSQRSFADRTRVLARYMEEFIMVKKETQERMDINLCCDYRPEIVRVYVELKVNPETERRWRGITIKPYFSMNIRTFPERLDFFGIDDDLLISLSTGKFSESTAARIVSYTKFLINARTSLEPGDPIVNVKVPIQDSFSHYREGKVQK